MSGKHIRDRLFGQSTETEMQRAEINPERGASCALAILQQLEINGTYFVSCCFSIRPVISRNACHVDSSVSAAAARRKIARFAASTAMHGDFNSPPTRRVLLTFPDTRILDTDSRFLFLERRHTALRVFRLTATSLKTPAMNSPRKNVGPCDTLYPASFALDVGIHGDKLQRVIALI